MSRKPGRPENLLTRFMSHVIKTDGCWEWIGCKSGGYGRIWVKKENRQVKSLAHRISWEMFRGPISNNLFVCHTCDNPPCVNPDHLWLGTKSDNTIDMWKKGRARPNFNIWKHGRYMTPKLIREHTLKSGGNYNRTTNV